MKEKGFITLILPLIVLLTGGLGTYAYFKYIKPQITTTVTQTDYSPRPLVVSPLPNIGLIPTSQPTTKTSTKTTNKPTAAPTAKSTATSTSGTASTSTANLCDGYNLTGATGGVEISVVPATGYLQETPYAEIKSNGCKTFDGQSRDSLTNRGYSTSNAWGVTFGTVPPGTYTVRLTSISSDSKSVTVTSGGQLAKVTINVAGDTRTVTEKPICTTPVALPSASGPAPLSINAYIGYVPNSTYQTSENLKYIQWDFTGDGSWDVTTPYGNPSPYTYSSSSTYTLKGRLQAANGDYSDPCQTTITVN